MSSVFRKPAPAPMARRGEPRLVRAAVPAFSLRLARLVQGMVASMNVGRLRELGKRDANQIPLWLGLVIFATLAAVLAVYFYLIVFSPRVESGPKDSAAVRELKRECARQRLNCGD